MATKKMKKKNHLPFRLNLLFLFVFGLFTILVLRLGVVQIVNGEEYSRQVEDTQQVTTSLAPARGKILDTKGRLLADNKAELAVVYTRVPGTTAKDHLAIAQKLVKLINVTDKDISKINERDLKDYWITINDRGETDNAYTKKLTAKELTQDNAYKLLLDRITKKDLKSITKSEMKVIAIKRELDQSMNLSPHYVKVGLSNEELARIGEHKDEFDGRIDTAVAAKRKYPQGDFFFLGKVGKIPSERVDEYLAKGYQRNDLVGNTYLEQEYEDVLHGNQTQYHYTTKNGKPVGTPEKIEGSRGDDIVLTVDSELQKAIGKILEKDIKNDLKNNPIDRGYYNSAYVTILDPHTGGIKAIVGRKLKSDGTFEDSSYGAVYNSYQFGSSVKGATVLTGYQNHAIPGTISDKPFHYKSGNPFKSHSSAIGYVNPVSALKVSSNVYMGRIVANMAGFDVVDRGPFYQVSVSKGPKFVKAVKNLREGYSEFGLGVHTGIDLPSEGTGYNGGIPEYPGNLMMFSIGQFDTYTPLQMAQYVSTIANGGYRIQPHFLQEIREPDPNPNKLGPVLKTFKTNILNRIKNSDEEIKTVQKGFYEVTHVLGGTAYSLSYPQYRKYKIAAKTGTAQVNIHIHPSLINSALVGYAPYDNPEMAFSIMVPEIRSSGMNLRIAKGVFDAYYKIYHPELKKDQ